MATYDSMVLLPNMATYDSMVLPPNMSPINNSSNSFSQFYDDPLVTGDEQVTQKRKIRNGTAFDSAQSLDKGKGRKQKKCNDWMENEKKNGEESPKGYIHVRARRGQATDSHSLAERVRREKINERMKILQCLVPGCDKVTGKADKLDEIINYVQSLQNQVEFLSMKLYSIDPTFYDFGVDLEAFMMKSEDNAGLLWDLGSFLQ